MMKPGPGPGEAGFSPPALPLTIFLVEVLVSYKLLGTFFSFMTFFLDDLFCLFKFVTIIIIIIISDEF